MQTYLINLDRAVSRLEHMISKLGELDISYVRVPAVDSAAMTEQDYQSFCNRIGRKTWKKEGSIGCFLSHYKAWELVATGSDEYAMILEDDMHFSPDAKNLLDKRDWLPKDFDIVRLETSTCKVLLKDVKDLSTNNNTRSLAKILSTSWCAGAYIISKKCAEQLLKIDPKHYRVVDGFLFCFEQSPVPKSISLYQVNPAIAIQDKYIGSESSKGLVSYIETDAVKVSVLEFKTLLKSIRPNALIKLIQGYSRVTFK
jgi:glycosyl transferase, family 25